MSWTFVRAGVIAAAAAVLSGVGLSSSYAANGIPYNDPGKHGSITLCDTAGKAVTQGSVAAAPFVWSLHSDFAATGGFAAAGRTATYVAYQPRQGIDPGDWSGRVMAPASRYTDARHPTVQLTVADDGLDQMTSSYAPQWDGLIELRMYLAAPGEPPTGTSYAALTLQVSPDGKTWKALDPGSTGCHVGSAVSVSTILGVAPTGTAKPTRSASAAVPGAGPSANVHPGVIPTNEGPSAAAPVQLDSGSGSSSGWGLGIAFVVALFGAGGIGAGISRWRSRRDTT